MTNKKKKKFSLSFIKTRKNLKKKLSRTTILDNIIMYL